MNRSFTGFLFRKKKVIPERMFPTAIWNNRLPIEVMRDARDGLHAGKKIMYGRRITRTNKRMPKAWRPNIHMCYYHSDILNYTFHIPVSSHAIRIMDRVGGLDAFILYGKACQLASQFGLNFQRKLKYVIEHHPEIPIPPKLTVRYKNNQNKGKIDISNASTDADNSITS